MSVSEELVYEALRQVEDPELLVNIVDLGLVYRVTVEEAKEGSNVHVLMTLTTPACPFAPELMQEVRDVLGDLAEVGDVDVEVTLSPPWTPDRMTEDARDLLGMF